MLLACWTLSSLVCVCASVFSGFITVGVSKLLTHLVTRNDPREIEIAVLIPVSILFAMKCSVLADMCGVPGEEIMICLSNASYNETATPEIPTK